MRPFVHFATFAFAICLAATFCSLVSAQLSTGWKAHDLKRPHPTVVTPAKEVGGAPSDAVVLFDGKDMSQWRSEDGTAAKWEIVDGAMESVPKSGHVFSKETFGDCQVHIEFASPVKVMGSGQGRGNSGVFLMGDFEVQVLDSFENPKTYADGTAGSIYGQFPPEVNVCRAPGQWQSYDIIFRRPKFDKAGKLQDKARITVLQNGVLIQDAVRPAGPTDWIQHNEYDDIKDKAEGPLRLQDHGNPVRYRNIWVRRLEEPKLPESPYDPVKVDLDIELAKKLVGKYGGHTIELKQNKLYFNYHRASLEMVPRSATEYGFKKSAGMMTVKLDGEGNPTAIEAQLDATGKSEFKREQ